MVEYIDRQAAIEKIRYEGIYDSGYSDEEREDDVVDMIESIPVADVRPVMQGKWILKDDGRAHCSMCDTPGNSHVWNFCPNCGADMRPELQKEEN